MKSMLYRLWKDEEGAEIAEWVVVVALLVGVGYVVYNQVLQGELSEAVGVVGDNIQKAANSTTIE